MPQYIWSDCSQTENYNEIYESESKQTLGSSWCNLYNVPLNRVPIKTLTQMLQSQHWKVMKEKHVFQISYYTY